MDGAAGLGCLGGEVLHLPGLRTLDRHRRAAPRRLARGRRARCRGGPRGQAPLAHPLLEDRPLMKGAESMEIRGPVELPARREDIDLETLDGLTLVGELAL